MAVRTKLLASGRSSSSTPSTIYTVPTAETAIIKSIVLMNINASTTTTITLGVDTAANDKTAFWEEGIIARKTLVIEPYLVLPPGYEVNLSNSASVGVNFWVSGTELEGVAD